MNKKKDSFHFKETLIGVLLCLCIILAYNNSVLRSNAKNASSSDDALSSTETEVSTEVESDLIQYKLDIKEMSLKTENGAEVTLHTPDDWYSLTDQYLDNLKSYFNSGTLEEENMFVVGNADTPTSSTYMINATPISEVRNMMQVLYGDDFNEEEMIVSEAYTYMTTGELPEDVPDNYALEEIETVTVGDISFKMYEINYDTTYVDDSTSESAESTEAIESLEESTETPNTTVVHSQYVACYSDTEDPIEIIIYSTEFDRDMSIQYLKDFLGV